MIKIMRVDERLIHGQIAMVWSKEMSIDGIVVANDATASDETQQMALKMAVPSGIKVIIKTVDSAIELLNDPRAQNMKLFVLVRTVDDAEKLAEKVSDIQYVNLGNVGKASTDPKTTLTQFVMLTKPEIESLKKLVEIYPDTALQNLPTDKKEKATDFIKKMNL
ncbi:phosphotransferase enzyme IIB component [Companilactobacillus paralimentarius DSM 13238 = JCM 10415]|jgi:Phosphotransferase system, mannose/fructose/N-acetylgalactosamine-specific component IIB|uniref:Phosphotransferase enzyme IIB component n=1 Tax=Companilactobacillus paralimentarius DSM 13238 = JCM 10415 TaxID=1122151 RepID=A0A0R1PS40_9LACO|nr:PTS sugar transporter subunit IIB [Companilactobacillus paralimentarius]KAE9556824.1 PTS sorbose transporter subunit IIB [Companilactobacillus paralimentarius]KRL32562.1 phosphotransferase enzyme IIB component [Companilactobacillus paralimentarius DSM 13238 = JCM 10415]MDR4933013.1 PTS sugar transporter subunit IIB [Companilactobacillus paralimentarius]QFR69549.1 PTS mannose/fructose/sorbose transporter subunit IIB [Companilactobacillus paralimentarius]